MTYNKNIPFNDLPDLPPLNFVESPEILKAIGKDLPLKATDGMMKTLNSFNSKI